MRGMGIESGKRAERPMVPELQIVPTEQPELDRSGISPEGRQEIINEINRQEEEERRREGEIEKKKRPPLQ